jgi:beta-alanine degradation protein BauB
MSDPTMTDPDKYKIVFENERVRVLEYRDKPGARTQPHSHPDSVMITMSTFERRLILGEQFRDVTLTEGEVRWLDAQSHAGENIGSTPSHAIFIELKDGESSEFTTEGALGPS